MVTVDTRELDNLKFQFDSLSQEMKLNIQMQTIQRVGRMFVDALRARVHKVSWRGHNSIHFRQISANNGEILGIDYLLRENARGNQPTKPPYNMPPHNFIDIVIQTHTPSVAREIEAELTRFIQQAFMRRR